MKFVMLGKYTTEAIKNISKQRTEEVKKLINSNKGRVEAMYVLMGAYDLIIIVNFPSEKEAIKTSVELTKLTGIGFMSMPAITVADFDKLVG